MNIALWIAAAILTAAVWKYRKLLAQIGLTLLGRNDGGGIADVLSARANRSFSGRTRERIAAQCRTLSHDPEGYELWETPNGSFWVPKASRFLMTEIAEEMRGIYQNKPGQWIRAGDVVLDCGANVGLFTRVSLDAGAAKVIAIEPAPENLACLQRNFSREIAEGKVILVPKGVFDRNGSLGLLTVEGNSAANTFIPGQDAGTAKDCTMLPVVTIDTLVAELGLAQVGFVKMDIEGSEEYALAGAKNTLARCRPRMAIASYHATNDPAAIRRIVKEANPEYSFQCGSCYLAPGLRLKPEVMFFN